MAVGVHSAAKVISLARKIWESLGVCDDSAVRSILGKFPEFACSQQTTNRT
jgi:hypothetical protein